MHLSGNHSFKGRDGKHHELHDICDELAGKYPKDFKFTGWHPNCRCYATTILKSEKEMDAELDARLAGKRPPTGSWNEVKDVPDNFKQWTAANAKRIKAATEHGTLPYFFRDNQGMLDGVYLDRAVKDVMVQAKNARNEIQGLAENTASKYGAFVTPINLKSIDSIKRKVFLERKDYQLFAPNKLKDTVRTTIIADGDDIKKICDELSKVKGFIRHKPQRTELGYTGNIINVEARNGLTGEIQVNTEKMIYAKEQPEVAKKLLGKGLWNKIQNETGLPGGLGHKYYKEFRDLDPNSLRAKEIIRLSREYYKHFVR